MLDLKEQIKDFKPVDLSGLSSEDALYTESMRIAFTLYNKALKEINEGYRDLAKNSLRKAVTHYPEFGDAMIVLGICTFVNGDRIGAVRIFNAIKKPDDRKRGMEILDRLASAPDYIPPRSAAPLTPPVPEERNISPVYEKPVFGKYSEPVNPSNTTSHTVQTDFIPNEIRPASRTKEDENSVRPRGVRSQYAGSHRQELMRKDQPEVPDAKPYVRPSVKQALERSEQNTTKEEGSDAVEKEPTSSSVESVQTVSGSIFGNNKILMIIMILLAAFAILAGAAWMSASAENRKLQADLEKRPTPAAAVWTSSNL